MAGNTSECPNGIAGNDMMKVCLNIRLPDEWSDTDELPENLTMEVWANTIKIKPSVNYLYCGFKKVSYRKTSGNAEKMIATFGKYVDRLYALIKEEYQAGNLLDFDMALIKSKKYFI